jgi:hypothetical protein
LWGYLDDTVGGIDRSLVDEHLARCLGCCGELEFAVELRHVLAACQLEDVPDDVRQRLHETLKDLGQ